MRGANHPGSFQNGTQLATPEPGDVVTTPRNFGNKVDWSPSPSNFGNVVNWTPSPSHFGNVVSGSQSPFVESVSPASGPVAGGITVTILGSGFQTGATVLFGNNAATSVVVVDSNHITCTTPAGENAGDPPVTVLVTNTDGLSGLLGNAFTYTM